MKQNNWCSLFYKLLTWRKCSKVRNKSICVYRERSQKTPISEWNELANETFCEERWSWYQYWRNFCNDGWKSQINAIPKKLRLMCEIYWQWWSSSNMKGSWEQKQSLGSKAAHKYKLEFRIEMVKQTGRWGTSSWAGSKINEWLFDFC